jgi:hypothetical protein
MRIKYVVLVLIVLLCLFGAIIKAQTSNRVVQQSNIRIAVVVPYIEAHMPKIQGNFKLWIDTVPCAARTDIDLVFYSNRISDTAAIRNHTQYAEAAKCFRRVLFRSADISPKNDVYPQGPNLQWKKMFRAFFVQQWDYILLMEPDVVPIRNNWLSALHQLIEKNANEFMVMGSLYCGRQLDDNKRLFAMHINGNAIYNTKMMLPFVGKIDPRGIGFREPAYDMMLFELVDRDRRQLQHLYRYTSFIRNAPLSEATVDQMAETGGYLMHVLRQATSN